MTSPVTLHNLYYLIDTTAWLSQRVGAHHSEYSAQVQDFVHCEAFDDACPALGAAARMHLWCAAHGFTLVEAAAIEHDDAWLTKPITIVLAATPGVPAQPLALVSIDGQPPQVYTDAADEHFWLTVATIRITCPTGHGWTWRGDPYLYAADGSEEHVATLYGPSGSVISGCRDCAAFDDGAADDLCPCPGYAVYCPICTLRCQVGLPEIPTIGQVPA